jgi:thiol-disulfide isomerase/thioredoxin
MKMRLVVVLGASFILLSACSDPLDELVIAKGQVVACTAVSQGPKANEPMELPCLDGKSSVDISNLTGPAIVNVWASWCPPCVAEMDFFRQLEKNRPADLLLLGVNLEEAKTSDGTDFIVNNGITWPNVTDAFGLSKSLNGTGVPVTLFINEQGEVVHREMGAFKSYEDLTDRISQKLNIKVS